MQTFLIVAAAHFLALLSPGPDFFLVARTSLAHGWRVAAGACIGITLGNAAYLLLAFAGVGALDPGSGAFRVLQAAGGLYLLYLAALFWRHAGRTTLPGTGPAGTPGNSSRRALAAGATSALLNPKNGLFYASLASVLASAQVGATQKTFYAAWMLAMVLGWDLAVAAAIGHAGVRARFSRALPWLERGTAVFLLLFGCGVLLAACGQ